MVTGFKWLGLWGLSFLDIVWLFCAVISVLCSGSCKTSSILWSGLGYIHGTSGECGMGCNYAC